MGGVGSLFEPFLELALVRRHLLARLAAGERRDDRPEQAVSLEVELDRHLRVAVADRLDHHGTDGSHRAVHPSERHLAGRVVLRDLVGDRLRPAWHAPDVGGSRPHPRRAIGLPFAAHDLRLPFAVPLEVVQIGEHILGTARDLDAVNDRRHARIVHLAAEEVNPDHLGHECHG